MKIHWQHKEMAAGKWYTLSIYEQIGNIGSEVHRTIIASEKGDIEQFRNAFSRAIELFVLTAGDNRWNYHRKREITRSREVFCDLFFGGNSYKTDPDSLDNYFMQYAIASQIQKLIQRKVGTSNLGVPTKRFR